MRKLIAALAVTLGVTLWAAPATATTYPTISEGHCWSYNAGSVIRTATTCATFYSRRQSDGTGVEWTGVRVTSTPCDAFEADGNGKYNPANAYGKWAEFPYIVTDSYNLNGIYSCDATRTFSVMGPDTGQMHAQLDLHARLQLWPDRDLTFDPCLSPSGAC